MFFLAIKIKRSDDFSSNGFKSKYLPILKKFKHLNSKYKFSSTFKFSYISNQINNIDLKKKNIGILITDHNVQETLSITDRAYLLFEGKILKSGTAEELASDEQVRKVYLGQNFVLRK